MLICGIAEGVHGRRKVGNPALDFQQIFKPFLHSAQEK